MTEPESGNAERPRPDESPTEQSAGRLAASPSGAPAAPVIDTAEETASLLKQLTIGTVIDGKYKIDEIIGRGAMGVVVAATHVHLRERVALKFLSTKAHGQNDDFHSRFRREAQVSAKLRNEHITRVIDVGVWRDKVPFMVMDHLVGFDLRRTMKQTGALAIPQALDWIVQICEGLAEAHSHGIVHRDLKPSNLFVTKRPDGTELIKILDFGISKWTTQEEQLDELTQTGVVLGSPKYMAPEQLFGSATVDARADIWSIGAIFYEMLTGRPPYDFPTLTRICAELAADKPPPSLKQFIPDCPGGLEAVVMRCFARDREQRVQSVAELAGDLLESVEAPFANQVRAKIGSMLDPRAKDGSLASSSGGMPLTTGNYRSLSISGSNSAMSSSGALRVAAEAAGSIPASTAGGVEASVRPGSDPGKRKAFVIAAIVGALLLVGVLVFSLTSKHPEATGATPAATTAAGAQPRATTEPTLAPTAATTTTTALAGTAQPSPTAATTSADSAAALTKPATQGTPPASHGGAGPPRGGGHHGSPAPKPPPAPPPAATAAPTPPPAPAPAPTTTAKPNPLEDRQ